MIRVWSPSSGSTLMISAPWSASSMVQIRAGQHLREIDDPDAVEGAEDVIWHRGSATPLGDHEAMRADGVARSA